MPLAARPHTEAMLASTKCCERLTYARSMWEHLKRGLAGGEATGLNHALSRLTELDLILPFPSRASGSLEAPLKAASGPIGKQNVPRLLRLVILLNF
jgi:hypothetical protein